MNSCFTLTYAAGYRPHLPCAISTMCRGPREIPGILRVATATFIFSHCPRLVSMPLSVTKIRINTSCEKRATRVSPTTSTVRHLHHVPRVVGDSW